MFNPKTLLITGGSGLLGGEMRNLLPEAHFPAHTEFDITDYESMTKYLKDKKIDTLLHAAAFTSPPRHEQEPLKGIETNIIGTALVAKWCIHNGIKLVYISTDYVFKGDRGNYQEDDPMYPVNKYAWSKLGGECAVQMVSNSLIIRTSFGPNSFAYPKAFIDQWTSRQSVSAIARKVVRLLEKEWKGVIHVGGPRRTVFEYAKELDPAKEIGKMSIREIEYHPPVDTSLNTSRYEKLIDSE